MATLKMFMASVWTEFRLFGTWLHFWKTAATTQAVAAVNSLAAIEKAHAKFDPHKARTVPRPERPMRGT